MNVVLGECVCLHCTRVIALRSQLALMGPCAADFSDLINEWIVDSAYRVEPHRTEIDSAGYPSQ